MFLYSTGVSLFCSVLRITHRVVAVFTSGRDEHTALKTVEVYVDAVKGVGRSGEFIISSGEV